MVLRRLQPPKNLPFAFFSNLFGRRHRFLKTALALSLFLAVLTGAGLAQTSSTNAGARPAKTGTSATKKSCPPGAGFCFSYPASWQVLGDAYVNGVIIAPEQKLERQLWDEITVAMILLPPEPNQPTTSIDQVIETAMAGLRESGRNPETLQRQQRTIDGNPAQVIRVRYHDEESARDWVEQLAFIEGPDKEIYSVALKCVPDHFTQLEPAFAAILRSWKITKAPEPENAPDSSGSTQSGPPHSRKP